MSAVSLHLSIDFTIQNITINSLLFCSVWHHQLMLLNWTNFQHYFIQAYQHPNKWSAKIINKYKLKIFLQILGKQPLFHIQLCSAIYWMCVFGLLNFNRWKEQYPFKCTSCLTKRENTVHKWAFKLNSFQDIAEPWHSYATCQSLNTKTL
jgi:hypothetical protein